MIQLYDRTSSWPDPIPEHYIYVKKNDYVCKLYNLFSEDPLEGNTFSRLFSKKRRIQKVISFIAVTRYENQGGFEC